MPWWLLEMTGQAYPCRPPHAMDDLQAVAMTGVSTGKKRPTQVSSWAWAISARQIFGRRPYFALPWFATAAIFAAIASASPR